MRIATMMVNGSTAIGTIPIIIGTTMARSPSSSLQLSSFLARTSRHERVLFCELTIPTAKHLADFFERNGECNIFFRLKRFGLPENQQKYFQRFKLAYGEPHPWLLLGF